MNVAIIVDEIALDGAISIGSASRSTMYRWTKAINEYCERESYQWRVKADYREKIIKIQGGIENGTRNKKEAEGAGEKQP